MKKFIVRPSHRRPDIQPVTVVVDDEDAALLRSQPWIVTLHKGHLWVKQSCASSQTTWARGLGQIILGSKEGEVVEHINHDALDFRKSNLRIVPTDDYYRRSVLYTRTKHRAAPA